MIVCHCKAVSDRAIRRAVRAGARTPGQVSDACGAGRSCGGCGPTVCELIARESEAELAGIGAVAERAAVS